MGQLIRRRQLLAGAGSVLLLGTLEGCRPATLRPDSSDRIELPPLRLDIDRLTDITVCTRPFRAEGPRLDVERIGEKTVVHNYGHGGSGWSLSWGSGSNAMARALATGERDIAVIGCGAIGLTSALLLQRAGAHVTIYAKELPPHVRSSLATGVWSPDSRICLAKYATPTFKQKWEGMALLLSFLPEPTGIAGQPDRAFRLLLRARGGVGYDQAPRRDDFVFQVVGDNDYYGYGDDKTIPDRAEAEHAIRTIAGLFA
jgi:hypothetical protein